MNKYKLLAICFMTISIILAGVILVQTWLTTPIRFEGATEDIYILRSEGFTIQALNRPYGKYGYGPLPYLKDSNKLSIIDQMKIYHFLSNLKPAAEKPLTDLEMDPDCFILMSAPYYPIKENARTGISIMSCGGKYIRVNRAWHTGRFSPWEQGEKWYYEVGEAELTDFTNSVIAMIEKGVPKDYAAL